MIRPIWLDPRIPPGGERMTLDGPVMTWEEQCYWDKVDYETETANKRIRQTPAEREGNEARG